MVRGLNESAGRISVQPSALAIDLGRPPPAASGRRFTSLFRLFRPFITAQGLSLATGTSMQVADPLFESPDDTTGNRTRQPEVFFTVGCYAGPVRVSDSRAGAFDEATWRLPAPSILPCQPPDTPGPSRATKTYRQVTRRLGSFRAPRTSSALRTPAGWPPKLLRLPRIRP